MKKILIALQSENMAAYLQERLSQLYCVLVCHNGYEAAELLREQEPDVFVLDLMLPGIDGSTLLEIARDGGVESRILAVADYISDHMVRALEQAKVDCLMKTDTEPVCMLSNILDLVESGEEEISREHRVRRILAVLGFKMHTVGCRITEVAICRYAENIYQPLSTRLYPDVAELCCGTVTQVEKAIRTSVENAWKERSDQVWAMYFAKTKTGKVSKPSNADFLARIALCVLGKEEKQTDRTIKMVM